MPFVVHQNAEGNSDGHGHDDERPADPGRVVHGQEPGLWDEVDRNRDRYGHDCYGGHRHWKAKRRWPPVQAVQVEYLRDPYQSSQVVEAVVHEKEEPEVHLHTRLAVAGRLASRSRLAEYMSLGVVW